MLCSILLCVDLGGRRIIKKKSMCFWKSSEDSADDHNDKECVYYNRSLELKGM